MTNLMSLQVHLMAGQCQGDLKPIHREREVSQYHYYNNVTLNLTRGIILYIKKKKNQLPL